MMEALGYLENKMKAIYIVAAKWKCKKKTK